MKHLLAIVLLSLASIPALTYCKASVGFNIQHIQTNVPVSPDSTERNLIWSFLHDPKRLTELNFPGISVRLYEERDFRYVWFGDRKNTQLLNSALSMLNSVLQYGFTQNTFHRIKLNQKNIQLIQTGMAEEQVVGATDIILTDAIISLIVQLHYGAANPYVSYLQLDRDVSGNFRAEMLLSKALLGNFELTIHSAQPQNSGYKNLQNFMRQATRDYSSRDKYDIEDDTLQLVALNLERYRWQNLKDTVYVEINIPSFILQFRHQEEIDTFKVIVGTPRSPTPMLTSQIYSFETAPDWNVPARIFSRELLPKMVRDPAFVKRNNFAIYNKQGQYLEPSAENLKAVRANPSAYYARQSYGCDNALGQIVFRFDNPYGVYLHDTPQRSLFNAPYRALSHGCIRLQDPRKLAFLLLAARHTPSPVFKKVGDAMDHYKKLRYAFPPVPIVIRYITCSVQDDRLVIYQDIYDRDIKLIEQLFRTKNEGNLRKY